MSPFFKAPSKEPSPAEQAAAAEQSRAAAAQALDDEGGGPASQVDNLVVVEGGAAVERLHVYSHPKLRLSPAQLLGMNRVEILSVGFDRAYWKRGVASKTKSELIATFLEAQSTDQSLHDEPSPAT